MLRIRTQKFNRALISNIRGWNITEPNLQTSGGSFTANPKLYTHLNYKLSMRKDTDVLTY